MSDGVEKHSKMQKTNNKTNDYEWRRYSNQINDFPTDERQVSSFNETARQSSKLSVWAAAATTPSTICISKYPGSVVVVTNTDRQALLNSPVPEQVLLGPNTSRGLGAGNKPEKPKRRQRKAQRSSPNSSTRTQNGVCHRRHGRRNRYGSITCSGTHRTRTRHADRGHCHDTIPLRGREKSSKRLKAPTRWANM